MIKQLQNAVIIGASAILLTACGGGSSSTSSSSGAGGVTPPPAPTNAAPTATITVSDMAPNEGKTSSLDGSGSSDPDGDTLTYSWTQLSGTNLVFSAPTASQTDIIVPNLTADESARIQLQVSDGTLTTTEEVTLTLTNVVLSPVANSTITSEETLSYTNKALALPTFSYFFETTPFLIYEAAGRYIWDSLIFSVDNSILEINSSRIESDVGKVVQASVDQFSPSFAVLSTDKASFVSATREPADLFSIDIDNPCDLVSDPRRSPGNIFIGQVNNGAKLIELATDANFEATGAATILQSFGDDASFCEMQVAQDTLGAGFYNSGQRLISFDQNTNQISEFSITNDNNGRMIGVVENTVIPVALDLPAGSVVEFITSIKIGAGMALVFSDGETEGLHRLVIIGLNSDGSILQETYSWSYGAPNTISHAYVDDHQGDSLLITTKDSPHAVIFKSGGFFAGDTPYLPLSGPSYFDLGIGHDLVAPITGGSPRTLGIVVTYPDQNLIKVLKRN